MRWRDRLTDPIDWAHLGDLSGAFHTCYVGEKIALGAKIETRKGTDWIPADAQLKELAFDFDEAIQTRNAVRAREVMDQIDARIKELT